MSDHSVYVRRFTLTKHPNADKLSLATPEGTSWQCVVRTDEFVGVKLAAYIPIETKVEPCKEFDFLGPRKWRVKTIRLRGQVSQGLLIPARKGWKEGQDVTKELGVSRYEKPEPGQFQQIPKTWQQKFKKWLRQKLKFGWAEPAWFQDHTDIENIKNFPHVFEEGEEIVITEKIDGTNYRIGYDGAKTTDATNIGSIQTNHKWYIRFLRWLLGDKFLVGSHFTRKDPKGTTVYSEVFRLFDLKSRIEKVFKGHQVVIFGEIFGWNIPNGCKKLWYGTETPAMAIFDIKMDGKWLPWTQVAQCALELGVNVVPVLYQGPYSREKVQELTTGQTTLAPDLHVREGVVVRSANETPYNNLPGRRKWLKSVSPDYLMLKDGDEEQRERWEELQSKVEQ
jgi:hypothetical protein